MTSFVYIEKVSIVVPGAVFDVLVHTKIFNDALRESGRCEKFPSRRVASAQYHLRQHDDEAEKRRRRRRHSKAWQEILVGGSAASHIASTNKDKEGFVNWMRLRVHTSRCEYKKPLQQNNQKHLF